ncbi:MAG: hypothetical protein GF375_05520, partial [Candidatus Omnitrophica bacterium]|nr:hypothetical protein [Candidatus Omnitrophota bacterium]MBD3269447.1 hypothetical protein [Candidatus Omnitrophota bacterium]
MDKIKRILIVSGDEKLKDVLSFCFDGWGYEVFLQNLYLSQNVIASVESIKKFSPDIIVLDIQHASKEQINICKILKENFTTAFIP